MKENKILYKILKIICTPILKILYRPKVRGTENIPEEGPVILVGNHKHAFDAAVVMANTKRIVHYMAKESLFKGIHGLIFKGIGLIKVYRSRSNPTAVVEAVEILKNGGTVRNISRGNKKQNRTRATKIQTRCSSDSKTSKRKNNTICNKRRI